MRSEVVGAKKKQKTTVNQKHERSLNSNISGVVFLQTGFIFDVRMRGHTPEALSCCSPTHLIISLLYRDGVVVLAGLLREPVTLATGA